MLPPIKDEDLKMKDKMKDFFDWSYVVNKYLHLALSTSTTSNDGLTNARGSSWIISFKRYLQTSLVLMCRLKLALIFVNDSSVYAAIVDEYKKWSDYEVVVEKSYNSIFALLRSLKRQRNLVKALISVIERNRIDPRWDIIFGRFLKSLKERCHYIERVLLPDYLSPVPAALVYDTIISCDFSNAELRNALLSIKDSYGVAYSFSSCLQEIINCACGSVAVLPEEELKARIERIKLRFNETLTAERRRLDAKAEKQRRQAAEKELARLEKEAIAEQLLEIAKNALSEAAHDVSDFAHSRWIDYPRINAQKATSPNHPYMVIVCRFNLDTIEEDIHADYAMNLVDYSSCPGDAKLFATESEAEALLAKKTRCSGKNWHYTIGKVVQISLEEK